VAAGDGASLNASMPPLECVWRDGAVWAVFGEDRGGTEGGAGRDVPLAWTWPPQPAEAAADDDVIQEEAAEVLADGEAARYGAGAARGPARLSVVGAERRWQEESLGRGLLWLRLDVEGAGALSVTMPLQQPLGVDPSGARARADCGGGAVALGGGLALWGPAGAVAAGITVRLAPDSSGSATVVAHVSSASAAARCRLEVALAVAAGPTPMRQLPPDVYKGVTVLPACMVAGAGAADGCAWLPGPDVPIPVPDQSMTFNALCLAGAVASFVVGSAATIALRRPRDAAE